MRLNSAVLDVVPCEPSSRSRRVDGRRHPWRPITASMGFVTAGLVASSLALMVRDSSAQQQPNGDCKCPTIRAVSTPNDVKDICTEGETAGQCTLKWNAPPGRSQAEILSGQQNLNLPSLTPQPGPECALRPSPICSWIDFLKRDQYDQNPESAAVGFVLLLAAGLADLNSPDHAKNILEEVRSTQRRQLVGRALMGGERYSTQQPTYSFTAGPGCVEARSTTGQPIVVVVQNLRSRNAGPCVPR